MLRRWSFPLLILLLAGVIVYGVHLLSTPHQAAPRGTAPKNEPMPEPPPVEQEIRKILTLAFDPGPPPDALAARLSGGDASLARLRAHRAAGKRASAPLLKLGKVRSLRLAAETIWMVQFRDTQGRDHAASFERDAGQKLRLHWEAMTGWGEISWAEFQARKPREPVLMRAYLRHPPETLTPPPPRPGLKAIIVRSKDNEFEEIAWFPAEGPVATVTGRLRPQADHPFTLRLAYVALEDGVERVVIAELEHPRWIKLADD